MLGACARRTELSDVTLTSDLWHGGLAPVGPSSHMSCHSSELDVVLMRDPLGLQAVVSYDRKHWTRTETEYDEQSGNLIIKHTPRYVRTPLPTCARTLQSAARK